MSSLDTTVITDEKIKNVPLSKVKSINTLDTNAHAKTVVLEKQLRLNLEPIVQDILNSKDDASAIYFNHNEEVKTLMRSFIEMIYRVGSFYTNMANGTPPKNTDIDQDQIKKLSEYGTNLFFKKMIWFADREQKINRSNYFVAFQNKILESFNTVSEKIKVDKSINIVRQIDAVVRSIAFLSLNTSVVMKTRQLKGQGIPQQIKFAARSKSRIRNLDREISQTVVWVTAGDERVCWRYCSPLDGETFNTLDPDMPIPILSTHENCRCRLMNVTEKGDISLDLLLIASIMNLAREVTDQISPLDLEEEI